jgi:hypothetical protein
MKKQKLIRLFVQIFMSLSAMSILSVSLMAWRNPQSVMDLVGVKLGNNDALSSIRGIYGGVGLLVTATIIYLIRKNEKLGLGFLGMLWGLYALSRITTIVLDGKLGAFGTQWLIIESIFFFSAIVLNIIYKPATNAATA